MDEIGGDMSKFDELKTALAEATNNGEYAQARVKEVVERLERILEKIEEAKRLLCFKGVEEDFDKLIEEYEKKHGEDFLTSNDIVATQTKAWEEINKERGL
jgi:hypothetical protein